MSLSKLRSRSVRLLDPSDSVGVWTSLSGSSGTKLSHASTSPRSNAIFQAAQPQLLPFSTILRDTSHIPFLSPHTLTLFFRPLIQSSPILPPSHPTSPHLPYLPTPSPHRNMSATNNNNNKTYHTVLTLLSVLVLILVVLSVSLPYFLTSSSFTDGSSYRRSQLSVGAFSVCTPGDHGQACSSSSIDHSCAVPSLTLQLPHCDSFNAFRYVLVVAVALWGVNAIMAVLMGCFGPVSTTRSWKALTVGAAVVGYVACVLMLTALGLFLQWTHDSGVDASASGACFGLLASSLAIGTVLCSSWLLLLLTSRTDSTPSHSGIKQPQATEMHGSRMTPVVLTSSSSSSTLTPQPSRK